MLFQSLTPKLAVLQKEMSNFFMLFLQPLTIRLSKHDSWPQRSDEFLIVCMPYRSHFNVAYLGGPKFFLLHTLTSVNNGRIRFAKKR